MEPGKQDIMAQGYFLAQLEAAKGKCACKVCQILRRASDQMTAQFLQPTPAGQVTVATEAADVVDVG